MQWGKGGANGGSSMGMCIVSYVKESRGDLPHGSGSSNWFSVTTQRRGMEGGDVWTSMADSC